MEEFTFDSPRFIWPPLWGEIIHEGPIPEPSLHSPLLLSTNTNTWAHNTNTTILQYLSPAHNPLYCQRGFTMRVMIDPWKLHSHWLSHIITEKSICRGFLSRTHHIENLVELVQKVVLLWEKSYTSKVICRGQHRWMQTVIVAWWLPGMGK